MNVNMLYDAIGEIKSEYIEDAEFEPHIPRRPMLRIAAAILAAVMLALPVSAEMVNGYISNLLAPLYGSAKTEF